MDVPHRLLARSGAAHSSQSTAVPAPDTRARSASRQKFHRNRAPHKRRSCDARGNSECSGTDASAQRHVQRCRPFGRALRPELQCRTVRDNAAQFGTMSGQCRTVAQDNVGQWAGQAPGQCPALRAVFCAWRPIVRGCPADVAVTCAQRAQWAQQPVQQPEMLRVDTCDLRQGYAWGRSPLFTARNCSLYAIVRRGIVRGLWHVGRSRTAFCCVADWFSGQWPGCASDSMIGERLHW